MIYVEHPSLDPFFHFALEWHILHQWQTDEDVLMVWRTQPTVMMGRYQNALVEINLPYAKQEHMHIVRRVTGGGTIYTDPGTWQFSILSNNHGDQRIDFPRYVDPVVAALQDMGLPVIRDGRNDMTLGGLKVSGNAQYASRRRTLHHGSLLFDVDMDRLENVLTVQADKLVSKGIRSVRQRVTNLREHLDGDMEAPAFREALLQRLLKPGHTRHTLSQGELEAVEAIAREKFRSWQWNEGNSPRFQLSRAHRFEGGRVEMGLEVREGYIRDCSFQGDFFGGDVEALRRALLDCPYRREDVSARLDTLPGEEIFHRIGRQDILALVFGEEGRG